MKYLVIYAHPNPKSFNNAVKETVVEELRKTGREVSVRDLYSLNFDPLLKDADFDAIQKGAALPDVKAEQDHIRAENDIIGLLSNKKVLIITTTGAPQEMYEESGMFKSMGQTIDEGIFRFCGMEIIEHKYLTAIPYITENDRKKMLEDLKGYVREKLIAD